MTERWDGTAEYLRKHGHRVFAPTLTDEYTCTLTDHIEEICRLPAASRIRS
ncbi:hypothetical protein [Methanoplanus limicola]|uniref:hypothetical protein n=1 Tax=Methanoplanus limicola TaxID=2315 RepID=UPI0012F6F2C3|nr:hypothetical protein [Methanoplanus limicola]